jgi:hypothetical protein
MNIEEMKLRIKSGVQQYFNRDQVIAILDKLQPNQSKKSSESSEFPTSLFDQNF